MHNHPYLLETMVRERQQRLMAEAARERDAAAATGLIARRRLRRALGRRVIAAGRWLDRAPAWPAGTEET